MKNLIELLKNYPKGTKLYSPIFGEGELIKVADRIHVHFPLEHNNKCFDLFGRYSKGGDIMLFPSKDNLSWDDFENGVNQTTKSFKYGDIIINYRRPNDPICTVLLGFNEGDMGYSNVRYSINSDTFTILDKLDYCYSLSVSRLANEEERKTFLNKLKDRGFEIDNSGEIVSIPKFQYPIGSYIRNKITNNIIEITGYTADFYNGWNHTKHCLFSFCNIRENEYDLFTLKFKVGNIITNTNIPNSRIKVTDISDGFYILDNYIQLPLDSVNLDDWLVCNDCSNISFINWNKGFPKDEGKYLVSIFDEKENLRYVVESFYLPISHNFLAVDYGKYKIEGWFKISEILPCHQSTE